jgi:hypothetical protein
MARGFQGYDATPISDVRNGSEECLERHGPKRRAKAGVYQAGGFK